MNKLTGFSGLRSLDQLKSLAGSGPGTSKIFPISSRPISDSNSSGSFANLKLTAEKLIKEQASAKTDLELANSKVKKLTENIKVLEEKLQNAFNENVKLKVKQKEDEKLWKGLESKFSSTKTFCDLLTETLQCLAGQVQDAEKDSKFLKDKVTVTSLALDTLNEQMKSLSLKLDSSEENVRKREKELQELFIEKEEREKFFQDEKKSAAILIEGKDTMIKSFEATIAANGLTLESLKSKVEQLHLDLGLKEDTLKDLQNSKEVLEKEKINLTSTNKEFANRIDAVLQEIKNLEDFTNVSAERLIELDNQSIIISDQVIKLNALFDSCFKMLQEQQNLAAQKAREKIDQLHDQLFLARSEKDVMKLVNQDLNNKVFELQKEQELSMVQHADECHLAEERIRKLEADAETLLSKKKEMESLTTEMQNKIENLSESSKSSEKDMKDLLLKFSALETENRDNIEIFQAEIQNKQDEIHNLLKEIQKYNEHVESLEKQVNQLGITLEEKEQLVLQHIDTEKQLEDKKAEMDALLADAESKLAEAKRQYDQMLESKQLELSRHLKEISQKNDQANSNSQSDEEEFMQAINDIRRKYEVEKQESVALEKEKAEKVIEEMEKRFGQKLAESEEESKQYLMRIQEEHATSITRIQQDHEKRMSSLISSHSEELKHVQRQSEDDCKEKIRSLRSEHEVQLKALTSQHEDECRKLQEELDVQKSKEDRQRRLLQLQWKVMGDKPQEDQEVTSKKNYSTLLTKMRKPEGGRGQHAMVRAENEEMDSPFATGTQTPVSNLLKRVEKGNTGSVRSIPKHSRKVTHHEYEVETANGRTITKRRKTKSTVMFGDQRKNKRRETPTANTPRNVTKGIKGGVHSKPSNIGDLFSEESLNPYADDPYAFD